MRRGEPEDVPVTVAKAAPASCCDAYDELERLADGLVQKDGKLTKAGAIVKALDGRPDLYTAHVAAHRGG